MKIAIDFDGTCVEHAYPNIGKEAPHAVDVLRQLAEAGHELYLWTLRDGDRLAAAVLWFTSRGIPLSGINHNPAQTEWTISAKCWADVYIDDCALGCPMITPEGAERGYVDWPAVRKALLNDND